MEFLRTKEWPEMKLYSWRFDGLVQHWASRTHSLLPNTAGWRDVIARFHIRRMVFPTQFEDFFNVTFQETELINVCHGQWQWQWCLSSQTWIMQLHSAKEWQLFPANFTAKMPFWHWIVAGSKGFTHGNFTNLLTQFLSIFGTEELMIFSRPFDNKLWPDLMSLHVEILPICQPKFDPHLDWRNHVFSWLFDSELWSDMNKYCYSNKNSWKFV